jgi:hypothetical protein
MRAIGLTCLAGGAEDCSVLIQADYTINAKMG